MGPKFAFRSFLPHGILLGSAFPKPSQICLPACLLILQIRLFPKENILSMPKTYNTPHRNVTVKTRLTKEEYAAFEEVADLCGVSKAAFIRKAITGALLKPTIVITSVNDELLKKLDDLIAQYGKIGGNLNQIARHLNEYGTPYADLEKEVRDAAVDLAMLKYEILEKVAAAVGNIQTHKL